MADRYTDENDIGKLIRKNLEETEISKDMIVYSQRTAFVYGEEEDITKQVPIEDFLINILEDKGPVTRGTLASLTNIPRTTLYDILAKLIEKGEVDKKPIHTDKRGRPKVLFFKKEE